MLYLLQNSTQLTCISLQLSLNKPSKFVLFVVSQTLLQKTQLSTMAEDLQDEWWEEYRKKSSAEEDEADKNDNELSKRQKKLKKRKRKIEEVNTTAMSAEDDVKTALIDVAGTVLKEELSSWIESSTIRLVFNLSRKLFESAFRMWIKR